MGDDEDPWGFPMKKTPVLNPLDKGALDDLFPEVKSDPFMPKKAKATKKMKFAKAGKIKPLFTEPMVKRVKFSTEIVALQFTGNNITHIMELLGYEVNHSTGQITLYGNGATLKEGTPQVSMHQSFGQVTLEIAWPWRDQQARLSEGQWLVRFGDHTTIMSNNEFNSLKVED